MKTLAMWNDSKLSFTTFATPGDEVDDDTVDHFLNVLPPRTWKHNMMIQVGEEHDYIRGRPTYLTFVRRWNGETPTWEYAGCCHADNDVHAVEYTEGEEKLIKLLEAAWTALEAYGDESTLPHIQTSLRMFRMQKLK